MRLIDAVKLEERGYGSPCWIWQRYITKKGYGAQRVGRAMTHAHRISYMSFRGAISDGLVIDHLCRVRSCVNPIHLEPVTNRENAMRGMSPAIVAHRAGRCGKGHQFRYRRTTGVAYCLECARDRTKKVSK